MLTFKFDKPGLGIFYQCPYSFNMLWYQVLHITAGRGRNANAINNVQDSRHLWPRKFDTLLAMMKEEIKWRGGPSFHFFSLSTHE